jgi:hypothetical protein
MPVQDLRNVFGAADAFIFFKVVLPAARAFFMMNWDWVAKGRARTQDAQEVGLGWTQTKGFS